MTATEKRIIAAAHHCFETIGLRKTRMEDVAAEASVSRQTVYKYFTGKQDIVDRIVYLEMVKINKELRETLRATDAFADRLTEVIVLSVEISLKNPYIRRALEDIEQLPGFPSRNARLYDWQIQQWSRMLDRARATGELAADINIDVTVQWITLCQVLLMISYEKLTPDGVAMRPFVRRFMVEALLNHSRPTAAITDQSLAEENAALRQLVSSQALEIFRLQQQISPAQD